MAHSDVHVIFVKHTCSQPVNRQPTFFQNRPGPIFVTVSGILLLSVLNISKLNQFIIEISIFDANKNGADLLRFADLHSKFFDATPSPSNFDHFHTVVRKICCWRPLWEILNLPLKLISTNLHFLFPCIQSVFQMINSLKFSTTITTMSSSSTNSNPSNHDHSAITTNNQKSDHVSHASTFLM